MARVGACSLRMTLLLSALLLTGVFPASGQSAKPTSPSRSASGKLLFVRNCSFCHGRDAAGGESGPDLTRSRLVARDVRGDKIRAVVHDGRIGKGMPPFPGLTIPQVNDVIAFIRDQAKQLISSRVAAVASMLLICKLAMLSKAKRILRVRENAHRAIHPLPIWRGLQRVTKAWNSKCRCFIRRMRRQRSPSLPSPAKPSQERSPIKMSFTSQ